MYNSQEVGCRRRYLLFLDSLGYQIVVFVITILLLIYVQASILFQFQTLDEPIIAIIGTTLVGFLFIDTILKLIGLRSLFFKQIYRVLDFGLLTIALAIGVIQIADPSVWITGLINIKSLYQFILVFIFARKLHSIKNIRK